jgi:hypothetical protein
MFSSRRRNRVRQQRSGSGRASRRVAPVRSRLQVEALEARLVPAIKILHNFHGISFHENIGQQGITPPDTIMAVGPTAVVETVNDLIQIRGKAGATLLPTESMAKFFASVTEPHAAFTDPQVMYDDLAGRFYISILDAASGNFGGTADLDFAVSNDANPLDGFTFYKFTSVEEGGTFPDFPKMGWNADAVYVSFNQFFASDGFSHDQILEIPKADLLVGASQATVVADSATKDVATADPFHILIPARMHDSVAGQPELFVSIEADATGGPGTATLGVWCDGAAGPTAGAPVETTVSVDDYFQSPGVPRLVPFAIDDRMLSVDFVTLATGPNAGKNVLVASHNIGHSDGFGNFRNLARWYEIDVTTPTAPVLIQDATIIPGANIDTWYPSIAINQDENIGISYGQSSSSQAPSAYVTGHWVGDPLGTTQPGVLVAAGVSGSLPGARGGDYSGTEYDPSNPATFWSANEYALGLSSDQWGTQITHYRITSAEFPPTTAVNDFYVAQSGVTQTFHSVLDNDFLDPTAGPPTVVVDSTPSAAVFFSLDPATGIFTFRSRFGFHGQTFFKYHIEDGDGSSNEALVTINVR